MGTLSAAVLPRAVQRPFPYYIMCSTLKQENYTHKRSKKEAMKSYIKRKLNEAMWNRSKHRSELQYYVGTAVAFAIAAIIVGAGLVKVFEIIKSLF